MKWMIFSFRNGKSANIVCSSRCHSPGVNFINILRPYFCTKRRFGSFSLVTCPYKNNVRTKNSYKKCWWIWQQFVSTIRNQNRKQFERNFLQPLSDVQIDDHSLSNYQEIFGEFFKFFIGHSIVRYRIEWFSLRQFISFAVWGDISYMSGVSNSVSYAGHILTKKGSRQH
jgi:hypothetical protein